MDAAEKPDWWLENERLRGLFDLPPYTPPRFSDGTFTHEVVTALEREHGVDIRFVGANTHYPEDWEIRLDGAPLGPIGRHRDGNGNTVYELSADEFTAAVEAGLGN